MKPSQFAKGFQARPDTTSSEKRTALDRLNAIDGLVKNGPKAGELAIRTLQPASTPALVEAGPAETLHESPAYHAWRIEYGYRPGQVIELPLKAIKASPFNPRHFYLKSSIAELAVNLAKQGQQQAIHVIPDYDNPGTYFVSDGGRRVRALKEANKESVKAIVIDLPIGIQSYKLGYDLNVQRDSQTVFDNAVVWKRFLDDKHFQSQKELAEHLGLDESTVAVALSIAKLPEVVMHEMVARHRPFRLEHGVSGRPLSHRSRRRRHTTPDQQDSLGRSEYATGRGHRQGQSDRSGKRQSRQDGNAMRSVSRSSWTACRSAI